MSFEVAAETYDRFVGRYSYALCEALASLEEPQRSVFVLRYYQGWPVESKHPGEPTISGYFGVTSRTIRNWLTSAEKRLSEWREERV